MKATPRHGHAPIPMRRVAGPTRDKPFGSLAQPGDFFWEFEGDKRTLVLFLPVHPAPIRNHFLYEMDHTAFMSGRARSTRGLLVVEWRRGQANALPVPARRREMA